MHYFYVLYVCLLRTILTSMFSEQTREESNLKAMMSSDTTTTTATTTTATATKTAIISSSNNGPTAAAKELASNNKRPRSESVVDSMLAEAHDLIGAAAEAQALGRLKMSSSYLLLVHARLITLGKRFDRSLLPFPSGRLRAKKVGETTTTIGTNAATDDEHIAEQSEDAAAASNSAARVKEISPIETLISNYTDDVQEQKQSQDESVAVPRRTTPLEPDEAKAAAVAKTLTKIIQTGIEFDATMMAHLAKAALDLHNKRQGDSSNCSGSLRTDSIMHQDCSNNASTEAAKVFVASRIAWTDEEHKRCIDAVGEFGRSETKEIAKAVGTRTEKEVIAHLRNASEKERATQTLHHELAAFAGA